jgi:hypothetical protein
MKLPRRNFLHLAAAAAARPAQRADRTLAVALIHLAESRS